MNEYIGYIGWRVGDFECWKHCLSIVNIFIRLLHYWIEMSS